jgi:ribosomal protein S18 acetylase RimI-like enzyme
MVLMIRILDGGDKMARMRCRDYQPGDWSAIQALWDATGVGQSFRGDSEGVIQRTLAQGGRFLILEEASGGPMLGAAWLTQDGRRFNLHHFVIRPDHQGLGLGHRLLAEALDAVRAAGLPVKLEVRRDNVRALELYRRHGFTKAGDLEVLILRDLTSPSNNGHETFVLGNEV